MKRRLRDAFRGKTSTQATDAAVSRGMADVLAALDTAIDDDTALSHIYAAAGTNLPGAPPGQPAATPAGQIRAPASPPAPARTTSRARTTASRRRLALRSAAAVAAALIAGALALTATGLPGAHRAGPEGPAINTAYVVKRVDRALDAAEPGAIAQMTVTTRNTATPVGHTVTATAEEWSYADQWRALTYTPAGHLLSDEGLSTTSVYTLVSYQTHTWARQTKTGHPAALAPGTRGCGPVIAGLPLLFTPGLTAIGLPATALPATVARALRAAVTCGTLTETGHQRVDGIQTIELTSRPGSPIPETIWVSPGTYLPVRVTSHPVPGTPGPWQTATITWLPPTPHNLAKLTVPIPAQFRRIPLTQAITPNLQHTPTRTKT